MIPYEFQCEQTLSISDVSHVLKAYFSGLKESQINFIYQNINVFSYEYYQ